MFDDTDEEVDKFADLLKTHCKVQRVDLDNNNWR